MAVEPLVEVQIAVKFNFRLLCGIYCGITGGTTAIEAVALIETAGVLSMLGPDTHTNPAKLVLAELTTHVVAPLILLDPCIAVGTFSGVC